MLTITTETRRFVLKENPVPMRYNDKKNCYETIKG